MDNIPGWIASYGNMGLMVWLFFEVRDLKRIMNEHVIIYHQERRKVGRDG